VDGKSLNQELGYDEVFNWRTLDGQPFYFFKKDSRIGVHYAGKDLPYEYDEVMHYNCCEPAAFNPHNLPSMVVFHGLRDGMWYYVETGVYDQPPQHQVVTGRLVLLPAEKCQRSQLKPL
jgi:hypothetical protein